MTDIREQAAKAAREWRAQQRDPSDILNDIGEAAIEWGYLLGHAAGYEAGAKAFARKIQKFVKASAINWRGDEEDVGRMWNYMCDIGAACKSVLASRPAPGTTATSRVGASCLCPTECDCENPEPADGCAGVSVHCPVHNYRPRPYPNCPVHSGTDEVKP